MVSWTKKSVAAVAGAGLAVAAAGAAFAFVTWGGDGSGEVVTSSTDPVNITLSAEVATGGSIFAPKAVTIKAVNTNSSSVRFSTLTVGTAGLEDVGTTGVDESTFIQAGSADKGTDLTTVCGFHWAPVPSAGSGTWSAAPAPVGSPAALNVVGGTAVVGQVQATVNDNVDQIGCKNAHLTFSIEATNPVTGL